MPRTLTTFEAILAHPVRAAIVKSILSRQDASVLAQIRQDIPYNDSITVQDQIRVLMKFEIVERDQHPTKINTRSGKPLYCYYISPRHESLQPVLRTMFPQGFEEVQA